MHGQMVQDHRGGRGNGALIAIGVPPTLPNFDQLVKLGKGKLVDLAVDLAKAAGVPCDEAGSVADLADQPDLSCEAAVEALLDEVSNAVNENFTKVAASGGLPFHPDMIIKPFWGGQPGAGRRRGHRHPDQVHR